MRTEMYTIFDDEVGRMKLEFWGKRVFIHYLAKSSPIKVARRALRIEKDVKRICLNLGFKVIEALFPDNKGLERLCVLWGFQVKRRENGLTLMECPNA